MKVELENVKPMDIEKRSFEIITEELGDTPLLPGTELVVKRCIHTSADFDYARNLCFSPDVIEKAMNAIKNIAAAADEPDDKLRERMYDDIDRVIVFDNENLKIEWKFDVAFQLS